MSDQVETQDETTSSDRDTRPRPEAMCPMASMCRGIFKGSASRFLLMLPGVLLVLVGIAIAIQPQVLVWLAAAVAILLGVAILVMANLVYRLGAKEGIVRG